MKILTEQDHFEALCKARPVVLVQFGTASCGPCLALKAKLEQWEKSHPQALCLYVPLEQFPRIAAQQGIFTAPALLVWAEGKPALRESGCFSLEDVLRRTERYLQLLSE